MKRYIERMKQYIEQLEKENEFPIIRYLVYFLIVTAIIAGVTFSRFVTSNSSGNSAHAAKFSLNYVITDPNSEDILKLNPSIYATCKLSDAVNCDFDNIALLRTIEITNASEVAVNISLSIADSNNMSGNGMVWCVLDQLPTDGKIAQAITTKLNNAIPPGFSELQSALKSENNNTFALWNADADLDSVDTINGNSSKVITIAFWTEHDIFAQMEQPSDLATTTLDFKLTVVATQID